MEFSSRISSKDYRAALRLKRKNLYRILYAVAVLDFALWVAFVILSAAGDIPKASAILSQAAILFLWVAFMLIFLPLQSYFAYRKNKNIRAEFRSSVTESGYSYRSSSGSSGEAPWSSFAFWRESRTVLLLVFPSNIFLIVPKSCLSSSELAEFQAILSKVLPKK